MRHSIEDLIKRINVMQEKAILLHRVRNEFSEISYKEYDKVVCQNLIDDIQAMALGIANDKEGDEIITEMDSWKQKGWQYYQIVIILFYIMFKDTHV